MKSLYLDRSRAGFLKLLGVVKFVDDKIILKTLSLLTLSVMCSTIKKLPKKMVMVYLGFIVLEYLEA
ncbi:hypothetical protein J5U22_01450 [Saccharolobus shibatae]|uniref:Uncharacterized protein n=1 Tax=Saccharolobus shibatae TaxID=2286 RepID=A0A8F5GZ26_9CREN|nr:hypothetical protein J5U22_01450 [Saccharolobus shibatae]